MFRITNLTKKIDMRKVWFLLLAAVAMSTALQSCDDGPKVPLHDEDGRIFLDKDNYIDALANFTDEEFTKRLLARKWYKEDMPYIYDTYNCQRLYDDDDDFDSTPPVEYQFYDNNHYDIGRKNGNSEYYNFEYSIKDKELYMSENYLITGESYTKKCKVVGISSERLVFDVDYDPELVTIPKGFMKFDKSTAKIRYVWRAVYY